MKKRGEKLKRATLDDLLEMQRRGEIAETHADAPTFSVPEGFWEGAVPFGDFEKTSIHLRIDSDVLDWFKAQGPGHLTRMNAVLRSYYEAMLRKSA